MRVDTCTPNTAELSIIKPNRIKLNRIKLNVAVPNGAKLNRVNYDITNDKKRSI